MSGLFYILFSEVGVIVGRRIERKINLPPIFTGDQGTGDTAQLIT